MILGTFFSFLILLATINPDLWGLVQGMGGAYGFHKLTQ